MSDLDGMCDPTSRATGWVWLSRRALASDWPADRCRTALKRPEQTARPESSLLPLPTSGTDVHDGPLVRTEDARNLDPPLRELRADILYFLYSRQQKRILLASAIWLRPAFPGSGIGIRLVPGTERVRRALLVVMGSTLKPTPA